MSKNNFEDFVPESLQHEARPAVIRQPAPRAWPGKAVRAAELLAIGFVVVMIIAWLRGLIDPPSESEALHKAYVWAQNKAPIGSEISYNEHGACEETFDGYGVRLIVKVPGDPERRYVYVSVRKSWRWLVID